MQPVTAVSSPSIQARIRYLWLALVIALALLRLCHLNLLWSDEDYHLGAALHLLRGKLPYRDFWYDKPPLCAVYYLLIGGLPGWPLRLLDAVYILLACYLAYRVARSMWSEVEGRWAAFLLAFFTTFYLPAAVIPFAADALLLAPHLAAIYYAQKSRPLAAGVWCAVGLLINLKAAFVTLVCLLWLLPEWPLFSAAVAIPLALAGGIGYATAAWSGFYEQVWRWGLLYAAGPPIPHPFELGLARSLHWLGFHAALLAGVVAAVPRFTRGERWKLSVWLLFTAAAVCLGNHFAPRYFLQVLPVMVTVASRGASFAFEQRPKLAAAVAAALLIVPVVRFGPRYFMLAADGFEHRQSQWSDVAMDIDSQHAAAKIRDLAHPADTLFVWGYRPDLYVYTRMTSASRFWDSQPVTGVPADRHLSASTAILTGPAARNRAQLVQSHPTFIVDGLGFLNPALRPESYPEIRDWIAQYNLVARTKLCLIYRRNLE